MVGAAYLPIEHILQVHHLTEQRGKGTNINHQVPFPFYRSFISSCLSKWICRGYGEKGSAGLNTGGYLPISKKTGDFKEIPCFLYELYY